jgi:hypothetical protein
MAAETAREMTMDQASQITLTFRCQPGLEKVIPRPIPAVLGLPEWFKKLPQKAFNPTMGEDSLTVKKCPPFIDAMTHGFLIPLATDLEVRNGEFSWNFELPEGLVSEFSHSPIDFHDPSQAAGTPFVDDERFLLKFTNFWTVEAPPGYSVLFTHPINRSDLPFTTLTGLVDCDTFHQSPIHFPARWNDADFNGVLPKGTPVVQCLPVKREICNANFETLSDEGVARLIESQAAMTREPGVYRRQFRAPKR